MKKRAYIPTVERAEESQALCDDFRLEQKASIQNTVNSKGYSFRCAGGATWRWVVILAHDYSFFFSGESKRPGEQCGCNHAIAASRKPR